MDVAMTANKNSIGSVNTQLSLVIAAEIRSSEKSAAPSDDCNQLQKAFDTHAAISRYASASLSDNTRRAYQGDLADFRAFGGRIPCTPEQLAGYISERAKDHNPFTIARRIVGISRAHTSQGMADPAKNDLVRAVLRGVRRSHGKPQRQVAPILKPDLFALVSVMRGNKGIRDRALVLLGFAAALRRSELVGLKVANVQFVKEGIILHIPRSKTDQFGEGRKIAVPYGRSGVCPVRAVESWISFAGLTSGSLFRTMRKGGKICETGLTSQAVALILKDYSTTVGLNAANIAGHSLRSGLVTSAAMMGVPSWKIRAQTGHKSDAMIGRYIRDASLFDHNAASAVL